MRVLITRPASDAPAWLQAIQAAGHEAVALPLIEFAPPTNTQVLSQAWAAWSDWQAVMFVSAQAVREFFKHAPRDALATLSSTSPQPMCWATGPGTRKALLQVGVREACIQSPSDDASQFDSEALWQRVCGNVSAGQRVLIVRGMDGDDASPTGAGRDWLAQQLQAAGVHVTFVVAYQRQAPVWTPEQQALAAQAAGDGSVWCFSSSQAVRHLGLGAPDLDWSRARCVVTHARIAQAAQALGFGVVKTSRPQMADVLSSLESCP